MAGITGTTTHLSLLGHTKLEPGRLMRPKAIAFLAYLLLEGRQPRAFMADLFWEGATNAQSSLRNQIMQLKPFVGNALIVTRQHLEFNASSDVLRFVQLIEQSSDLEAIAVYQGDFLATFKAPANSELEPWVLRTRRFLKRQALEALLRLATAKLVQREGIQATKYLEQAQQLLGHDLMLHGWLLPQITQLQNQIQAIETQVAKNNLWQSSTEFIGRTHEISSILEKIQSQAQLITLLGFGGIGKSRLALETARNALLAQQFLDGIYFVALETAKTSQEMLTRIVSTLEIPLQGTQSLLIQIQNFIKNKEILLVLDNLEQLGDEVFILADVFENNPKTRAVCTSREVLGLQLEHVYPLMGLETTDENSGAVQLFKSRASQVFNTQESHLILEIVRALQGIPLAIELAVPQLQTHTLPELQANLQKSMDLLAQENKQIPERQRSIRTVFMYSWALLPETERQALRRMAVFKNGANRIALEKIVQVSLSQLAQLMDKSFLQRAGHQRYTIHPLILEYTLEMLLATPEITAILEQHAKYYLDYVGAELPKIRGAEAASVMQKIEIDFDNLQVSWAWALENQDFDRVAAFEEMVVYFDQQPKLTQGIEFFVKATQLLKLNQDSQKIVAVFSINLAWLQFKNGGNQEAIQILESLEQPLVNADDAILLSRLYNTLGNIYLVLDERELALSCFMKSLSFNQRTHFKHREVFILGNIGRTYFALGDYQKTKETLSLAIAKAEESGNVKAKLAMFINLALAELNLSDVTDYVFLLQLLKEGHVLAKSDSVAMETYFEFLLAVYHDRIENNNELEYWMYRIQNRNEDEYPKYLNVSIKIFIGEICFKKGQLKQSLFWLSQAYKQALLIEDAIQIIDCKIQFINHLYLRKLYCKVTTLRQKLLSTKKIRNQQRKQLDTIFMQDLII